MTNRHEIHTELLSAQIASLFKYYNEKVSDKWVMAEFEPLIDNGHKIVGFQLNQDPDSPPRRRLSITVMVDDRQFEFFQNYNYGVPLSGGTRYTPTNPDKDIADIEYALSIATEHTAYQLSKLGE